MYSIARVFILITVLLFSTNLLAIEDTKKGSDTKGAVIEPEDNLPKVPARSKDLGNCAKLGEMLQSCKKYKCQMPHPKANKFKVDHEILGFKTDELLCHHTQTIPGNGIIDCKYSRAMRIVMAKQFKKKEELTLPEAQLLSDSFEMYCRVIE